MASRASRFVKRLTRSVRTCVRRVTRRKSRQTSIPIIPAVNVSRSSAGRASADIATGGTESTPTQDGHEAPATETMAASSTQISEPETSISTTGATVGVSDATTPEGSVYSLPEVGSVEPPINALEGVENEAWYNMGKRRIQLQLSRDSDGK